MTQTSKRSLNLSIPNLLTYSRIVAVPLFVMALLFIEGEVGRWIAALIFVFASISDFFDGYLARMWNQQSALGRMLDPIADKLLVGAALVMLVYNDTITGWAIVACLIILCREILVSGLREYLAELQVKLHVSWLAKWKTVFQMVALGVLIVGPSVDKTLPGTYTLGVILFWFAAIMTVWTGYGYLHAAVNHALKN